MENSNNKINKSSNKKRHGCVTAWLILLLLGSVFGIYVNLQALLISNYFGMQTGLVALLILSVINFICIILLFNWNINGCWGLVVSAIIIFVINLNYGVDAAALVGGLVSPLILYAVLQIKRDGDEVSAWDNLK